MNLTFFMLLASVLAASQITIDASGPIRARLRNPTSGHSGSFGRKLPIRLVLEPKGSSQNGSELAVDFVLTNVGAVALRLPASPHSRDFEPQEPAQSYSVTVLSLFITSGDQQSSLRGGAKLFGNSDKAGSVVTLMPGES